ncbi:MAG: hypothetical protein J6X30_00895, partial [Clostridia bacterium]|nr:hypothetical protein [Clostridia bacterium]
MTLTERLQGKRPLAARGVGHNNAVRLDESWQMDIQTEDSTVLAAAQRLNSFLRDAFSLLLTGREHTLRVLLAPGFEHGFSLAVSEEAVCLRASEPAALVKGLLEIEARMRAWGEPALKTGEETVTPRLYPRLALSPWENGTVSAQDAVNLLYAGYDGVAVPSHAPFPAEAKKAGLLCFLMCDRTVKTENPFDGVIWQGGVTDEALAFVSHFGIQVFDTLDWQTEPAARAESVARLPRGAIVLSSFEAGAHLTRGNLNFTAPDGLLAVTEASDRFQSDSAEAKTRGLCVWVRILTAGKIPYLANLFPLPAMMQHVLRTDGLLASGACGSLETGGFVPSFVSDYYREALRTPCDEPGVLVQRLAARDFGAAQAQTMALVFKKLSDAFSALVPLPSDMKPLAYAAAFPLTEGELYELPAGDVSLYTEQVLQSADHFRKAQAMLSRVPGN